MQLLRHPTFVKFILPAAVNHLPSTTIYPSLLHQPIPFMACAARPGPSRPPPYHAWSTTVATEQLISLLMCGQTQNKTRRKLNWKIRLKTPIARHLLTTRVPYTHPNRKKTQYNTGTTTAIFPCCVWERVVFFSPLPHPPPIPHTYYSVPVWSKKYKVHLGKQHQSPLYLQNQTRYLLLTKDRRKNWERRWSTTFTVETRRFIPRVSENKKQLDFLPKNFAAH